VNPVLARLVAVASAVLLAGSLLALYVTSRPGAGETAVRAEFRDVFPLLPGMHVRISGAVAGSVETVELTDRGTALVTMSLHEGTEPPAADATASIRQQDITGDSYVSLSPGGDSQPLGEDVIPLRDTVVAPRFDDLLNSFDPEVREGLQLIFVELGMALERRGADLNDAVLRLRPGLAAADRALAEVNSQNDSLRRLVADASRVADGAAGRSRELGELVDSLATTLTASASAAPGLDAALAQAPESAREARRVLTRLDQTAVAAQPLAETLAASAPDLAEASTRLGPFFADARAAFASARPTLGLVERLMRAAEPTLEAAPKRVLTAPLDLAAGIGGLLDTLMGDPTLIKALFGADGYGVGPSRLDDVGLGAVGVELGTQPFYGDYDPERRFLRAKPVLNCEVFGLEISPGCLQEFLAGDPEEGKDARVRRSGAVAEQARDGEPATPAQGPPSPATPSQSGQGGPLDDLLGQGNGGGNDGGGPGGAAPGGANAVEDLLDFLLGG
jgi:phospholipid/cholesterol/gamma-HCH transport system substrate-binding protein